MDAPRQGSELFRYFLIFSSVSTPIFFLIIFLHRLPLSSLNSRLPAVSCLSRYSYPDSVLVSCLGPRILSRSSYHFISILTQACYPLSRNLRLAFNTGNKVQLCWFLHQTYIILIHISKDYRELLYSNL